MKHIVFYILFLSVTLGVKGQVKPGSKANAYYVEAMNRYTRCVGDKDSMIMVFNLLDKAIKENDHFFQAYSEIVAIHCQLEQYNPACKTMVKMVTLFPNDIFINLLCGALQYKTGHPVNAETSYYKVIKLCDAIPGKDRKGDKYNEELSYKGVALMLLGKMIAGKDILKELYNNENADVIKSRLAYYINCTNKDQVLDDVIPGKWQ